MSGEIDFDEDEIKLPELKKGNDEKLSDSAMMQAIAEAVGDLPHESGHSFRPLTRTEEIRAGGFVPLNVGSMPGLVWDEVREWGDKNGLVNDKEILYHFIRVSTDLEVPDYADLHGRRAIPSLGVRKKMSKT